MLMKKYKNKKISINIKMNCKQTLKKKYNIKKRKCRALLKI